MARVTEVNNEVRRMLNRPEVGEPPIPPGTVFFFDLGKILFPQKFVVQNSDEYKVVNYWDKKVLDFMVFKEISKAAYIQFRDEWKENFKKIKELDLINPIMAINEVMAVYAYERKGEPSLYSIANKMNLVFHYLNTQQNYIALDFLLRDHSPYQLAMVDSFRLGENDVHVCFDEKHPDFKKKVEIYKGNQT